MLILGSTYTNSHRDKWWYSQLVQGMKQPHNVTKASYQMQVKYRICAEWKVSPGSQWCFAKTFGAQDSSPASKP